MGPNCICVCIKVGTFSGYVWDTVSLKLKRNKKWKAWNFGKVWCMVTYCEMGPGLIQRGGSQWGCSDHGGRDHRSFLNAFIGRGSRVQRSGLCPWCRDEAVNPGALVVEAELPLLLSLRFFVLWDYSGRGVFLFCSWARKVRRNHNLVED